MRSIMLKKVAVFLLCFCTVISGFSYSSYANSKENISILSGTDNTSTLLNVNNRILSSIKGNSNYNILAVDSSDKESVAMAGLLSLKSNSLIVDIAKDKIDENSEKIIKNSQKIYLIGLNGKVSGKENLLKEFDKEIVEFTADKDYSLNIKVNDALGEKDILLVKFSDNIDIVTSLNLAKTYDMNVMFVNDKIQEEQVNSLKKLNGKSIYFLDGKESFSEDEKQSIFKLLGKKNQDISNFSIDAKDSLKVFRDEIYNRTDIYKIVISESENLLDLVLGLSLSNEKNTGFMPVIDKSSVSRIQRIMNIWGIKEAYYISTSEKSNFDTYRTLYSEMNSVDFEAVKVKNINGTELFKSGNKVQNKVEKVNSRPKASEEITLKENEVVYDGKVMDKKDVKDFKYSRAFNVVATAYSASPEENGGWNKTKMGTPLNEGVIAVDPSIIPLGSRVYIESLDGTVKYGYFKAEDTGGAIKGNRIDILIKNKAKVKAFGRKTLKIYILK